MKNLFALVALVGMFALASCGGSNKDAEKAKADSLRKDSLMKDSIKKAEEAEKARLDSIAKAKEDSIAAAEQAAKAAPAKKGTNVNVGGSGASVSSGNTTVTVNTKKPVRGGN